jgi:heme exporter protein C
MQVAEKKFARGEPLVCLAIAGLVALAIVLILGFAPTERTMEDTQRILYIHVAVAWFGLLGIMLVAVTGIGYLVRRSLRWDHWSQASAEVGWLCSTLTLLTGSIWAHEAWNTWWTWDPRLTTSLILWLVYAGYFVLRTSIEDSHQRARVGAILGVLGALDVPLVVMATRWFRGIHPETPEMEPMMHVVLLASVVAFTLLFSYVLVRRCGQLSLRERVRILEGGELSG